MYHGIPKILKKKCVKLKKKTIILVLCVRVGLRKFMKNQYANALICIYFQYISPLSSHFCYSKFIHTINNLSYNFFT